jgi:anti-sigma regulatory factor (Ser/Thr protein kinase)
VLPSGHYQASPRYQTAAEFEPLPPDPDPLEQSAPAIEMAGPSEAQARSAVASIARGHLTDPALADLVLGTSEAVTNARRHGRPPVTLQIWAASGRVLIRVRDTGPGPADPLAGLVPAPARQDREGAGLWLIHVLGLDAAMIRSADGFTVRLAARRAG